MTLLLILRAPLTAQTEIRMIALKRMICSAKSLFYPSKDSFTIYLIKQYCRGKGVEIGPGSAPYSRHPQTISIDKFPSIRVDIIGDTASIPLKDNSVDFILSSHCLEHCPDTLKVLKECKRVIRSGGIIFLILPHGERTFDRGRQLTTLEHHLEDQRKGVDKGDQTHWEEFAKYSSPQYDHRWTDQGRNKDGSWNFEWIAANGHMHYHVWTQHEMIDVLKHIGCHILVVLEELTDRTDSFLVVACVAKGRVPYHERPFIKNLPIAKMG